MDTQQMEEQFNRIAEEYDVNRRKFIPCFDEYYEKTTAFAASGLKPPRRILDLGAGTGLLSMYYYRHFPRAEYVLADVAEAMLEVARRRFAGMPNVKFETADYTRGLPGGDFDLIVSALSVHHLETEQKAELFSRIHERLPEGGCFVNYDQFCADTPEACGWFDRYWIAQLYRSGLSETDLARWRERRKLDRECSLSEELAMLKNAGFQSVNCIYSVVKFSVIAAVK